MGRSAEFYTRVAKKEKNFGMSEKFKPKPLMGSTNYNSGFVKSYNFFSVGIPQESVVGLRQSSEVSRKWGCHTKELVVRIICGLALA